MLNLSRAYLGLLYFFFVIVFVITLFSVHPIYVDICSKDTYTGAENCPRYDVLGSSFDWIKNFAHEYHGILTALATIAIAWFTWTLQKSTRDLWRATVDASKRQEGDTRLLERAM
jgi:hypothetical protein